VAGQASLIGSARPLASDRSARRHPVAGR
jgi:hypothetical protein